MVINAGDVETCRRTWTRGIGAAARSAARQILRADARRSPSTARQEAGGELDRVLRAYLDDRHLKNGIDGLPSTAQSAGRALLTRRFFRIAALESGHYVLDYMVAGLALALQRQRCRHDRCSARSLGGDRLGRSRELAVSVLA
jgi:hypothetical protein